MKVVLSLLILCGCTYIGFNAGKNFKRKVKLYEDLLLFCGGVKSKISYFQLKLRDVLQSGRENAGEDFCMICDAADKSIEQGALPILSVENMSELRYLSLTEKEVIANFFSILGASDYKNQTEQINGFEKIFYNAFETAKEDMKIKGGLYGKLGIFTGLFIAILCL